MELGVGTWLIIASATSSTTGGVTTVPDVIYNPMIGSVYYSTQTSVSTNNIINADSEITLLGTSAYMKSIDAGKENKKQVGTLNADGQISLANANAQVGETVPYVLQGLIPNYSDEYFTKIETTTDEGTGETKTETTKRSVTYTLNDTIKNGLAYDGDIKVYVGGKSVDPSTDEPPVKTYSIKYWKLDSEGKEVTTTDKAEATKFTIEFESDYIEGLADGTSEERKVIVTYSAKITSNAVTQVAENEFDVSYTRVPGGPAETTDSKTAYSYTAAIRGLFEKVNENNTALAGATFTLYSDEACTKQIGIAKSDATGNLVFYDKLEGNDKKLVGLEFDKVYYVKETDAPNGYSINDTCYEVKCTYNEKEIEEAVTANKISDFTPFEKDNTTKVEKLSKYLVTIKNPKLETTNSNSVQYFVVSYGASETVVNNAVVVKNTKLNSLPSTGGIGTTIFTIGGCAIMIIAAGLYFSLRRKSAK